MTRFALAISHPSHELRLYGWLERERPLVYVLTDGGGRSGQPRISRTSELLTALGCELGPIFGHVSDRALYEAILSRDIALFESLAVELADDLIAREIDVVIGDAAEGYNSVHDVWRMIIDSAIGRAAERGHTAENYEYFVVAPPRTLPESPECLQSLTLDDAAFMRKMNAVRTCLPEVAADVDAAFAGDKFYGIRRLSEPLRENAQLQGIDIGEFRYEFFWRRRPNVFPYAGQKPFFETYAEELVRAGLYQQVIRYEEHLRPIREALQDRDSAPRSAHR